MNKNENFGVDSPNICVIAGTNTAEIYRKWNMQCVTCSRFRLVSRHYIVMVLLNRSLGLFQRLRVLPRRSVVVIFWHFFADYCSD